MSNRATPLIFAPSNLTLAASIARIIYCEPRSSVPAWAVYTHADEVRAELEKLGHQQLLVILLAAKREELDLMVAMADWFEDVPLVLVVPDHHRNTIAAAHRLRPRCLMGPDINFREMRLVIRNLIIRRTIERANWMLPKSAISLIGSSRRRFYSLKSRRRKKWINHPIITLSPYHY